MKKLSVTEEALKRIKLIQSLEGNGFLRVTVDGGGCSGFSYSFNFSIINSNNIKLFFPISLLENKYIPFDQYLIIYLIHHPIDYWDDKYIDGITELFSKGREKIEINTLKENNDHFYKINIDLPKTPHHYRNGLYNLLRRFVN